MSWDPWRNASILREAATECDKITTQLFNESFIFEFKPLRVALQRSQRLIKVCLALAKRSLSFIICCTFALNRLLLFRKHLHEPFALCDGNSCRLRPADEFAALHAECSASRLK
jgi:hypothetical protein